MLCFRAVKKSAVRSCKAFFGSRGSKEGSGHCVGSFSLDSSFAGLSAFEALHVEW